MNIVIFGLSGSYNKWKNLIDNEQALGGHIIGYSDNNVNAYKEKELFVKPQDLTYKNIDLVIICSVFWKDISDQLRKLNINCEMVYYKDFFFKKFNIHEKAVKFMQYDIFKDVETYIEIIGQPPRNFFEIGANFAQDATIIKNTWNIADENVHVFEAHPQMAEEIRKRYNYYCHEYAISNVSGEAIFNICNIDLVKNSGMSSLRSADKYNSNDYKQINVKTIRMDTFINNNSINAIDFCKIDVEGMAWEVLDGFGDKLDIVKCIQVEGSYKQNWEGERLFNEIFQLLWEKGFRMVNFDLTTKNESDSLWIRDVYLN